MDFPLKDLMDEQACYDKLVTLLHPEGLGCPRCKERERVHVHRRRRAPVLDYQCESCGRVFNVFTGTALQGTSKRPSVVMLILRGIAQGVSTSQLARELGLSRPHLNDLRLAWQERAADRLERDEPLGDEVVESDEMYQNAGEKRHHARRPGRPAASSGQQGAGARHVGAGPPAGAGHGRPRERAGAAAGVAPQRA